MSVTYTKPKLCKANDGSWYIWFRYNRKVHKFKKNLGKKIPASKKIKLARILVKHYYLELKGGWNPETNLTQKPKDKYYFTQALDFAVEKKGTYVSKKTFLGYRGAMEFIKNAITALGLYYLLIDEVKRSHIRQVLEKPKELALPPPPPELN